MPIKYNSYKDITAGSFLQRCDEFLKLDEPQSALEVLSVFLKSSKVHRLVFNEEYEDLFKKFIQLSTRLNSPLKKFFSRYRIICNRSATPKIYLGRIFEYLLDHIEHIKQKEIAKLSSKYSTNFVAQQFDSYSLEYIWNCYKNTIDYLRHIPDLICHYAEAAKNAIYFCQELKRTSELHQLHKKLNLHVVQFAKNHGKKDCVDLCDTATLYPLIEIRVEMFEAFYRCNITFEKTLEIIEEIETLTSYAKSARNSFSPELFRDYFVLLADLFWDLGDELLHANALYRLLKIYKLTSYFSDGSSSFYFCMRTMMAALAIPEESPDKTKSEMQRRVCESLNFFDDCDNSLMRKEDILAEVIRMEPKLLTTNIFMKLNEFDKKTSGYCKTVRNFPEMLRKQFDSESTPDSSDASDHEDKETSIGIERSSLLNLLVMIRLTGEKVISELFENSPSLIKTLKSKEFERDHMDPITYAEKIFDALNEVCPDGVAGMSGYKKIIKTQYVVVVLKRCSKLYLRMPIKELEVILRMDYSKFDLILFERFGFVVDFAEMVVEMDRPRDILEIMGDLSQQIFDVTEKIFSVTEGTMNLETKNLNRRKLYFKRLGKEIEKSDYSSLGHTISPTKQVIDEKDKISLPSEPTGQPKNKQIIVKEKSKTDQLKIKQKSLQPQPKPKIAKTIPTKLEQKELNIRRDTAAYKVKEDFAELQRKYRKIKGICNGKSATILKRLVKGDRKGMGMNLKIILNTQKKVNEEVAAYLKSYKKNYALEKDYIEREIRKKEENLWIKRGEDYKEEIQKSFRQKLEKISNENEINGDAEIVITTEIKMICGEHEKKLVKQRALLLKEKEELEAAEMKKKEKLKNEKKNENKAETNSEKSKFGKISYPFKPEETESSDKKILNNNKNFSESNSVKQNKPPEEKQNQNIHTNNRFSSLNNNWKRGDNSKKNRNENLLNREKSQSDSSDSKDNSNCKQEVKSPAENRFGKIGLPEMKFD